jgi:uncharacterized protein YjdB
LTLVILPEQFQTTPITWDSENKAVATVDDNGVVTTLTNGTTTITATAVINGKEATCSVEVRVPVSGLTVNPKLVTFTTLGVQATVPYAVVVPSTAHNKNVTWSSSNPAVATVNSTTGAITVITSGATNIIATSDADNTKSDYCAVTVTIPPASIALNSTATFTAASTGGSTTRYATVSPAQAANRNVSWSSSNTGVATVSPATTASGSNATITLVNRGSACGIAAASATIYARSAANSGIVASFTATSNGTAACPPPCSGTVQGNLCWSGSTTQTTWDNRSCGGESGFVVPTREQMLAACNAGVGGFRLDYAYWSSEEATSSNAHGVGFTQCNTMAMPKTFNYLVRCVKYI